MKFKYKSSGDVKKTWVSLGVETLFARNGKPISGDVGAGDSEEFDNIYDIVIVGSGYGSAIIAEELAGRHVSVSETQTRELKICVIERGKEFLPGSFPNKFEELPTEVRFSGFSKTNTKGNHEGLFDIRPGKDVNVVLANGLGGGSLINAGVMMRAKRAVFASWPKKFQRKQGLELYYDKVHEKLVQTKRLGGSGATESNNISSHVKVQQSPLAKTENLRSIDKKAYLETDLSIAMNDGVNYSGVKLNACQLCGDCSSGCNFQAKNSLDTNLLYGAFSKGVDIFTGGSVLSIKKDRDEWLVDVVYTHPSLRKKHKVPETIRCRNVVLAAGSLGSTEILLRSESENLRFSDLLGSQFSTNGDMIVTAYDQTRVSNSVASEHRNHEDRHIGPTITGMIDKRDNDSTKGIVIQDMAIPAICNVMFREFLSTLKSFHLLTTFNWSIYSKLNRKNSDHAKVNNVAIRRTSVYAAMGDDGAAGHLYLPKGAKNTIEGSLKINWKAIKNSPLFSQQVDFLNRSLNRRFFFKKSLKGLLIPNPLWKLLPDSMMGVFLNNQKGPVVTVHPLGGCPMGDSVKNGVTNHVGKVFDAAQPKKRYHEGLLVLDGAVIPTALGINPALTIAAVAQRGIDLLLAKDKRWNFKQPNVDQATASKANLDRPKFKEIPGMVKPITSTEATITERLNGKAKIVDDTGSIRDVMMEITLVTCSARIENFYGGELDKFSNGWQIDVDEDELEYEGSRFPTSKLRIYYFDDWQRLRKGSRYADMSDEYLNSIAQYVTPISGHIEVLRQRKTWPLQRVLVSLTAWWKNRGKRDLYQLRNPLAMDDQINTSRQWGATALVYWKALPSVVRLLSVLSRAGEVREIKYSLKAKLLSRSAKRNRDFTYFDNQKITGLKSFTYSRRSNPWRQLSEIELIEFPNQHDALSVAPVLSLDTQYLASRRIALFQITKQENQVQAVLDIFSFSMYMARLIIGVHFLSFRSPEQPSSQPVDRRPAPIQGIPFPVEHRLWVDSIPDNKVTGLTKGDDVFVHLTEFINSSASKPPVLLIHGYSASGSTFSHETIPNGLAKFFYDDSRTVWVADLRTSPVHKHSRYPWTFEQVANSDIPLIVNFVFEKSDQKKIDIIGHCMGSVMLSMALLNSDKLTEEPVFYKDRIKRIVFSQAAPALALTPENTFRSFLSYYLKDLIPKNYQFKPSNESDLFTQLLDRALYTLPYPIDDFDYLNPRRKKSKRISYAQTRHRMDAFYGRTFEAANMSEESLNKINDFFGPIHIETMNQVSQFARKRVLTTFEGQNVYLNKHLLSANWPFPTLSIHSINNGLVDSSTGERTKKIFTEAGIHYETLLIEDKKYGHQDSVLGPSAHIDIFPHMARFLSTNFNDNSAPDKGVPVKPVISDHSLEGYKDSWLIEPPQIGPMLFKPDSEQPDFIVSLGINESLAVTPYVVVIPIIRQHKRICIAGETANQRKQILDQCVLSALEKNTLRRDVSVFDVTKKNISKKWVNCRFARSEFKDLAKHGQFLILLVYQGALKIGRRAIPASPINDASHHITESLNARNQYRRDMVADLRQTKVSMNPSQIGATANNGLDLEVELSNQLELLFTSGNVQDSSFRRGIVKYKLPRKDDNSSLCFAFGSCQYPSNPFDRQVAYSAFENLDSKIFDKKVRYVDFLLLIGDQVYIDATAGFLDPVNHHEKFDLPYVNWLSNKHVAGVFRKLPLFSMLDDHEIVDNWEPSEENFDSWSNDFDYQQGINSFLNYQRGQDENQRKIKPQLWYSFREKCFDFFVMDTRTERSYRNVFNILDRSTTIISNSQFQGISDWLTVAQSRSTSRPKFIISSSALLPKEILEHSSDQSLVSAIRADGWDGYPRSLCQLLALIVDGGFENITFLCGDIHLNCVTDINVMNKTESTSASIKVITCSGLYSPLPFANRDPSEVLTDQYLNFSGAFKEGAGEYECRIKTKILNQMDCFALIKGQSSSGEVSIEFLE